MKLPSKVTSYKESVISKFPIVLESLSYSNETPRQLYEKEKQKLQQILDELEKIDDVPINIQNIIEKEQKYIKKMENEISKMKKYGILE